MNDFHNELNRVLRYSMNNAENLLAQLAGPEHNHTRWADGSGDHTFRMVTAGALEDDDRHTEAGLLADPNQHVIVHEGKVRPARFNESRLFAATSELADHIYGHDSDAFDGWSTTFHGDADPVNPTDHDDYEPLGPNEHRFWDGEYDNFHHHKRHITEVGPEIADIVDQRVEDSGDWEDQEDHPERWAEYDRLIHNVRNAPVEEVDTDHHTEQGGGRG